MAKQREVEKQFHGYHKGYEYEKAMKEAKAADQASYAPARPAPSDPACDAILNKCYYVVCCGCCETDPREYDPDNQSSSSCTVL